MRVGLSRAHGRTAVIMAVFFAFPALMIEVNGIRQKPQKKSGCGYERISSKKRGKGNIQGLAMGIFLFDFRTKRKDTYQKVRYNSSINVKTLFPLC
ncbi:MAG TPA: hypothetical protein DCR24_09285 [Bacillus bacterium]|nr:hypothetical protein [Bacillus sp. (in: firmicutes)]